MCMLILLVADLWSEEESLIVKNQPTIIKNKGRAQAICDMTLKRSYGRRYPKVNQFTVIINVDPQTNREQLVDLLRIYSSSPKVLQIYIHGNTPGQRLSKNYLRRLQLKKPVQLVFDGAYDTPNTRYNPIQGITTEAVYMTDSSVSLAIA